MRPWSNPERMPSSRLSLRLGQLPHAVLAELAAVLCSDSPSLQATAEECMAAHNPLPQEMVERVLLSPDLVPSILGPLETGDGAAAAVCSQWLAGWNATNEPRRRLKKVPLDFPAEALCTSTGGMDGPQMAATPDGRLVVRVDTEPAGVRILDRSMRVLHSRSDLVNYTTIAADNDSIFSCDGDFGSTTLRRSTHRGTTIAEAELEGYQFQGYQFEGVLSSGGLLFYAMDVDIPETELRDVIVALDAQTLQLCHRFGLGQLSDARQLAVVGDELYVCDNNNDRLQVFSFDGEHRRSVTGEWQWPVLLCAVKDRLFLVEDPDDHANVRGRRLLVLSSQGDVLQVVTHPTEPTAEFTSICCFAGKLLASFMTPSNRCAGIPMPKYGMLALRGL